MTHKQPVQFGVMEARMKIIAIMGSPRKGDSYAITREVETHLKEWGDVDFEYIFLKDIDIQPCRGCFLCTSQGEAHCPLRDDCPGILERMRQADGVIFVSPVYALSVTGLMKNFKDRLAYNAHRPSFFGKPALAIVTSAGTGLDGALGYLETFSLWGFNFVPGLALIQYPYLQPSDSLKADTSKKIAQAARRFHQAIRPNRLPAPTLAQVLQFRVLKCNTRVAGDFWQADREFYRDRREYFYPTSIAPHHRFIAWMFERFFMAYMRKNYVIPEPVVTT